MSTTDTQLRIVLPIADSVILPSVDAIIPLSDMNDTLIERLGDGVTQALALPLKEGANGHKADPDDFHRIGLTFDVLSINDSTKGKYLHAKLMDRVTVEDIYQNGDIFYATYTLNPEEEDLDEKSSEEMVQYYKDILKEISTNFQNGEQYMHMLDGYKDLNSLIVYLSQFMRISPDEKYEYLKTDSQRQRSLMFLDALIKQKETIKWNAEVQEKLSDRYNKYYREQVLRQQLKEIQAELKAEEGDDGSEEASGEGGKKKKDYRARIEEAGMPDNIREAALEEVSRLEVLGEGSAEESVIRNYLDFMLALPWKREPVEDIDLAQARRILDEDHYGLDKVKERILQHLAVMKLKNNNKGSILLLVGPPGTGKTSLGKSIARALGRKYIRLSLGGIRDESEIRGHRRTYVGAMPGRILQGIKTAGTTNPVMVLDEVDKLMTGGFSGDPASALLEVLDPEQNNTFEDHYLDLPYDLSDVFFIATANSLDTIPGPLLDRMEIIEINSYTADEKFHIAKEHLIGEVLEEDGLTADQMQIEDDALRAIIEDYTAEAGVRGLKKRIEELGRVVSEKIVMGEAEGQVVIRKEDLEDMLGKKVSHHDVILKDNPPGVVTGLAWTPVGGEILFIEATDMPGSGQIVLTGQLGDVMKESARISISLLKSRLPVNAINFSERDIHIHVPSGAVSKDGPSAGITLFTALASLVTGIRVNPHLAMTGEITLRGAVLPIGGLKEKLLGAQRAGITKVLIPKENVEDLKDLPKEVLDQITIVPVSTAEDVLREALGITLPRISHPLVNLDGSGVVNGNAVH
ncbi:MAG: endopeptidase La [Lachnospiraceae bacterium]|jgi:ATP-dependent Lon protease